MVNEERVILMTKLASYEKRHGKRDASISSFFRGDYIGFHLLRSFVSATIAFVIVFGMVVYSRFESLLQEVYQMDLLDVGKRVGIAYAATVVVYGLVSYGVYALRYHRIRKSLKQYYGGLKRLLLLEEER